MVASYVAPIATEQLLIKVGDGATPTEVFAAPCTINTSRSLTITADAKATVLARCDDPSAPGKTVRKVVSTDSEISGSGTANASDSKVYADWALSGAPKNIKAVNAVTGALTVTGPYVITSFKLTGSSQGEMVTFDITLMQADQIATSASA